MKTTFLTLAIGFATLFSAQAQDTKMKDKTLPPTQSESSMTVDQRAQRQTDRMTQDLNLNEDQSRQLMEHNRTYYTDYQTMGKNDMTDADRGVMYQESMDAYNQRVQGIMDDEQYEKFNSMRGDYDTEMDYMPRATSPNNKSVEPYKNKTEPY